MYTSLNEDDEYYIGTTENPTTTDVTVFDEFNWTDSKRLWKDLYVPDPIGFYPIGYYMLSPSADEYVSEPVCGAWLFEEDSYWWDVGGVGYKGTGSLYGIRPIIMLPSKYLTYNDSTNQWDIKS